MSKKMLREAVEDPTTQVRKSSNNILGRIYWTLVKNLDVSFQSFNTSLSRYVENDLNVSPQTSSKRSEKISNLTAELTCYDRMSWNKFIEGLKAIQIIRLRIRVEVWRGKREIYAETILDTDLCDVDTLVSHDPDDIENVDEVDHGK